MAKSYNVGGVYKEELDLSNYVKPIGTSVGAMITRAQKGRINREIITSDYDGWLDEFGYPAFSASDTPTYGYGHYAAEIFHNESNELHTVRLADATDKYPVVRLTSAFGVGDDWQNSAVSYTGVEASMDASNPDADDRIKSLDDSYVAGNKLLVGALGPGIDGQDIGITIESFNTSCDWFLSYDDFPTNSAIGQYLTSAVNLLVPSTTALDTALVAQSTSLVEVLPKATKVIKLSVYTKDTTQSWAEINANVALSALTPVEEFYGTLDYLTDDSNVQMRLKEVINGVSDYIYVVCNGGTLDYEILPINTDIFPLSGGAISRKTGLGDTDSAALTGWDFFVNKEYASVNILIAPDTNTAIKQKVVTIAKNRMDCIAACQSGRLTDNSVSSVKTREEYGYANPSYAALYAGWDKHYDNYNDQYLYIPKCIFGAALMARTDRVANTWEAPCGTDRGIIQSLGQYKTFSFTEIGQLQDAGINTSRWMKAFGHVMWGQKTAQIKTSALDRINVRRLLILIENSIEQALLPFCFNIVNDENNRLRVESMCNGFLDTLKGGANPGIKRESKARCNDTNNTSDIIDNNQLVVELFIDPQRVVETIVIRTIVTRSGGVSFAESIV